MGGLFVLERKPRRQQALGAPERVLLGAMRVPSGGECEIICSRKVDVDRLSSHVLWRLRCCRMGRPSVSSCVLSLVEAVLLRVRRRKCQVRRETCLVRFRVYVLKLNELQHGRLETMRSVVRQQPPSQNAGRGGRKPQLEASSFAS